MLYSSYNTLQTPFVRHYTVIIAFCLMLHGNIGIHYESTVTCRQEPQGAQVSVLTLYFLEIVCILLCHNLLNKQRQKRATVDTQFWDSLISV